jgi:hypothetical protein
MHICATYYFVESNNMCSKWLVEFFESLKQERVEIAFKHVCMIYLNSNYLMVSFHTCLMLFLIFYPPTLHAILMVKKMNVLDYFSLSSIKYDDS